MLLKNPNLKAEEFSFPQWLECRIKFCLDEGKQCGRAEDWQLWNARLTVYHEVLREWKKRNEQ